MEALLLHSPLTRPRFVDLRRSYVSRHHVAAPVQAIQWFGEASLCAAALRAGTEQAAEVLCAFYELCPALLHVSSLVKHYKRLADSSLELLGAPLATVQPHEVSPLIHSVSAWLHVTTSLSQVLDRFHALEQWVYSEVVQVLRQQLKRAAAESTANKQLQLHTRQALELQASAKTAVEELVAARDAVRRKVSDGVRLCGCQAHSPELQSRLNFVAGRKCRSRPV